MILKTLKEIPSMKHLIYFPILSKDSRQPFSLIIDWGIQEWSHLLIYDLVSEIWVWNWQVHWMTPNLGLFLDISKVDKHKGYISFLN